jgi:hypothetical protein
LRHGSIISAALHEAGRPPASVEIRSNDCVAPAYYATMGFAIPAALGRQVSSGRRPLQAFKERVD